jgi:uncharacterized protein (TIGR02611 family)
VAADPLAEVLRRRAVHRGRPLVVRIALAVVGGVIGLAGVLLVIPLPEAGLPLLLLGLRLLALEFEWAARAYGVTFRRAQQFRRWFETRGVVAKALVVAIGLAVVVAIVWWLVSFV